MIEVQNLSFSYRGAARPPGCELRPGSGAPCSPVLGPNGVGKSTLFRCILGLLKGYTGSITVDGRSQGPGVQGLASGWPTFPSPTTQPLTTACSTWCSWAPPPRPGRSPAGGKRRSALPTRPGAAGHQALAQRSYTQLSGESGSWSSSPGPSRSTRRCSSWTNPPPTWTTATSSGSSQRSALWPGRGTPSSSPPTTPEQSYLFSHRILAMQDGQVLANSAP